MRLLNRIRNTIYSLYLPKTIINLNGINFHVLVANTEKTREHGLMFQDDMPYGNGMLFVYDNDGFIPLWMKNTLMPLDAIWFDGSGNVIHVEKNMQPCRQEPCKVYSQVSGNARYVLEAPAGFVDTYNITTESKLA